MRALTASDVLRLWERGIGQSPAWRAMTLLGAACPESAEDELVHLSVGQRNRRLMELREATFGPRVEAMANCPECAVAVEIGFDLVGLRTEGGEAPPGPIALVRDGISLQARVPDALDLVLAGQTGDAERARQVLLERCVMTAQRQPGEALAVAELPPAVIDAIEEAMEAVETQANVQLQMQCPECRHAWSESFDIAAFLWAEVQAAAKSLLREVHELAWAYGWSEQTILAMPPPRRSAYLELIRS
jgi:hypothetical protein